MTAAQLNRLALTTEEIDELTEISSKGPTMVGRYGLGELREGLFASGLLWTRGDLVFATETGREIATA